MRIVGVTVLADGPAPAALERGAMIAANHVSWLDIFVLSAIRPTRFIAKSEIRDWPLAGWIAERAGTIFIRRDKRRDTARISERVHRALVAGDCIGLFPEGTTTDGDALLKFHSSLFEPAVANQAHVHPAAIRYERADGARSPELAYGDLSFMQSMALVIRQRGACARVSFAPVVETAGRTRREVALEAERHVASLLGCEAPSSRPRIPAGREGGSP